MRKLLLAVVTPVVLFNTVAIVYAQCGGSGRTWKCIGNSPGCAGVACISPSPNGNSCAAVSNVPFKTCLFTGNEADSCTLIKANCAKLQDFAGDDCRDGVCSSPFPIGAPYFRTTNCAC